VKIQRLIFVLTATIFSLTLVAGVAFAEKDCYVFDKDRHLTIIDEDGEQYEMFFAKGGQIRVVESATGEVMTDIDLEELAEGISSIVGEAMSGVHEALAEISQLDFSFDWDGDDSRLHCVIDDDDFDLDIDFDELGEKLAEALEGLDEIDFDDEMNFDGHRFVFEADDDDLGEEMDVLREEISELRKEIKQLRRRQRR